GRVVQIQSAKHFLDLVFLVALESMTGEDRGCVRAIGVACHETVIPEKLVGSFESYHCKTLRLFASLRLVTHTTMLFNNGRTIPPLGWLGGTPHRLGLCSG